MEAIEKSRCIDTIRVLAAIKGILLKTLESKAGVTPGYLSRAQKAGNLPPVEVLAAIADQLDVTIDFLVFHGANTTMAGKTNEISSLVEKLSADTYSSAIVWTRYPARLLTGRSDAEFKDLPFQIFSKTADDDDGLIIWEREFNSHFDEGATIAGDAFSAKLGGQDATIFLLSVKGQNGESQFEMYLESHLELEPICTTSALNADVVTLVRKLYEAVDTETKFAGLGTGMNKFLRQYLYGQKGE